MSGIGKRPEDVIREVRMRIDKGATDALMEKLKEQAGEELALALAGQADDVLVRGYAARIKTEAPPDERWSVCPEGQGRATPRRPAPHESETGSKSAIRCSPNG